MNIVIRQTPHKFLSADYLESARATAISFDLEEDRPGVAAMIRSLVTEIEQYRETCKGDAIIINHAGAMLKERDAAASEAARLSRELSQSLTLALLKASALRIEAEKAAAFIDQEIETRRNLKSTLEPARAVGAATAPDLTDRSVAVAVRLSNALHAAIELARP